MNSGVYESKPVYNWDLGRVWGLSAYFTKLPTKFQDHLIKRTEHVFKYAIHIED